MPDLVVLDDNDPAYQPLPEIYSIELTSACDLQCANCLRSTNMNRKPKLINVELLRTMHKRGDFGGSTFIELQMAGEPTIHPKLGEIISFLRNDVGLLVGLSTHGLNLRKQHVRVALSRLDTLTISVDSTDPETYHQVRYPGKLQDLIENIDSFVSYLLGLSTQGIRIPFVEFQLVKYSGVPKSGHVEGLVEMIKSSSWDRIPCRVRTNKDCFIEMQGRMPVGSIPRPKNHQICQNPFRSVSVNDSGDVLSCCMIFDPQQYPENHYGNLYENSLAEIWNGEKVRNMRLAHKIGLSPGQCAKCYAWSPVQIHDNIIRGLVRQKNQ